jgi:nucleolar protein 12
LFELIRFAQSGPIKPPQRKTDVVGKRHVATDRGHANVLKDDETSSSSSTSLLEEDTESSRSREDEDTPPRKRRKVRQDEDIESTYLERLAREDARDEARRQLSNGKKQKGRNIEESENAISSDGSEDPSDSDDGGVSNVSRPDGLPQHESLAGNDATTESDKVRRTVFLGNVSTMAIKSKSAKNTLLEHLRAAVKELPQHKPAHKVESLRFRSTAFVSGAGPKKAAFAKGELMDQTTKSTNAYVVYTTELAAQTAAAKLNGNVVLDRHLRADSLAMPTKIDHRRCIFIGNLSFVDEETQDPKNDDGSERRPKAKIPADAEEGLWRAFAKAGKVESVRMVRDKETRVGKGFAYVQFYDENAVEAALLMNDKKFPPMLPRKLRVMRAKRTKQKVIGGRDSSMDPRRRSTDRYSKQDKRFGNRSKLASRAAAKPRTKEGVVFEGHRASKASRESNLVSKHRKRHAVKPSTRSSKRGAAYKAAGGKHTGRTSQK